MRPVSLDSLFLSKFYYVRRHLHSEYVGPFLTKKKASEYIRQNGLRLLQPLDHPRANELRDDVAYIFTYEVYRQHIQRRAQQSLHTNKKWKTYCKEFSDHSKKRRRRIHYNGRGYFKDRF